MKVHEVKATKFATQLAEGVAFAATAIFLLMNGHSLRVTADEGEQFLVERAIVGRAPLDEIASWLEPHMRAV